jgi:hypothetical chaperone protein
LLAATDGRVTTDPLRLDPEAADPTVFRSILFFPHGEKCFYGQTAVDQYNEAQGSGRLIRSIKKFLPSESYTGSWIDDRVVRLEDLIGYFLLEMRKRACAELGFDVTKVVLGRPAKFSEDPVKDKLAQFRLEKAAQIAGFTDVSFLPEPLAAAFDLRRRLRENKTVLVVDLGGGTSDFTVIQIGPEKFRDQDVLAMGGVSIAGDVIDGEFMKTHVAPYLGSKVRYKVPLGSNILEMPKSLLDHICSAADIAQMRKSDHFEFFRSLQNWALRDEDRKALDRLFALVEDQQGFKIFESIDKVKRMFSSATRAEFKFDYPSIEIDFEIENVDFQASISSAVEKIFKCLDETVAAAGLTREKIDIVYCTGGTSKLKSIERGLIQRFGQEKVQGQDAFHSVIHGLAARAAELNR